MAEVRNHHDCGKLCNQYALLHATLPLDASCKWEHALAATGVASHWPDTCSALCGAVFCLPLCARHPNEINGVPRPGDRLCADLLMISSLILIANMAALGTC